MVATGATPGGRKRPVAGRGIRPEPEPGGASGWMDSAVMGAAGIPTVIFGPVGAGAHADVEWVSLASVIGAADVYARVLEEFCGASRS